MTCSEQDALPVQCTCNRLQRLAVIHEFAKNALHDGNFFRWTRNQRHTVVRDALAFAIRQKLLASAAQVEQLPAESERGMPSHFVAQTCEPELSSPDLD